MAVTTKFMRWMVACGIGLGLAARAAGPDEPRPVVIAVVRDGSSPMEENWFRRARAELDKLAEGKLRLEFRETDAGWDEARLDKAMARAMKDSDVALIWAPGFLGARWAAEPSRALAKPVIGLWVSYPGLPGPPRDEAGYSTRTNFLFVEVPTAFEDDLKAFRDLVPFRDLAVLVDERVLARLPEPRPDLGSARSGVSVRLVKMADSAGPVLEELRAAPPGAAVYLTVPPRMTEEERRRLIEGCRDQKRPMFSAFGHADVKDGALAGALPDLTDRLARRVALNIQRVVDGASPQEIPVDLSAARRLMVNARTARDIDYAPPYAQLMMAEVLYGDALPPAPELTLEACLRRAVENNLDGLVADEDVRLAANDRAQALAVLKPQLSGQARYTQIDEDRAAASSGMQPEQAATAGASLYQVLYSDSAWTQWRVAGRMRDVKRYEQETTRLDVAQRAAQAYVQYLSTRALLRIAAHNLRLMQEYLDLAVIRRAAGAAGPEEIYRWEAEVAGAKNSAIAAEKDWHVAMVALNQAMQERQDAAWSLADIPAGADAPAFADVSLEPLISNDDRFIALFEHCLATALEESPDLKALDASLAAHELLRRQYRRRFWVPEVGVQLSYEYILDESGGGPSLTDQFAQAGLPLAPGGSSDDHDWTATAQASWTWWDGGAQRLKAAGETMEIQRLRLLRQSTAEQIEARVRTTLLATGSSFPAIELTRRAADMARRNLDVTREKYARGGASILALLDAQNDAFTRDQNAELARYQFVNDLIAAQRAMSWFEALAAPEARAAWSRQLVHRMEDLP